MCGRYRAKQPDVDEWQSRFGAFGQAVADVLGRLEVRPTESVAVARGLGSERSVTAVRWGVQPAGARRPLINARADRLLESALWRRSVSVPEGRCLVLADGWYEWLHAEDPGVRPEPLLHVVDGGAPFAFAGVWGSAAVGGVTCPAVSIVTTGSVGEPARVHERQPVVLDGRDAEEAWLGEPDAAAVVDAVCVALPPGRVRVSPASLPPSPRRGSSQLSLLPDE